MSTQPGKAITRRRFPRRAAGAVGAAPARIMPLLNDAARRQALGKIDDSQTHKAGGRALQELAAKSSPGK